MKAKKLAKTLTTQQTVITLVYDSEMDLESAHIKALFECSFDGAPSEVLGPSSVRVSELDLELDESLERRFGEKTVEEFAEAAKLKLADKWAEDVETVKRNVQEAKIHRKAAKELRLIERAKGKVSE